MRSSKLISGRSALQKGQARAALKVNEQGFCDPIYAGTGREQSMVRYPRASGTSARFWEARAVRVADRRKLQPRSVARQECGESKSRRDAKGV